MLPRKRSPLVSSVAAPTTVCLLLVVLCSTFFPSTNAQAVTARPVKTVCTLPYYQSMSKACHATFATIYYNANFSTIDWRWDFITPNEDTNGPTARVFVKSWVLSAGHCDLLVGPGPSFLAVALSPLIDIPWIDASATSTELSDKKNHPYFSRMIPTDEVGAQAAGSIYNEFGWKRTNIMCSDEPYGRSVAAGVTSAIKEIGGEVEETRCFQSSSSAETVRAALETFLESETKVVFIAAHPLHDWFKHFKTVVTELGAEKKLVFFYSEAFCSGSDRSYAEVPGGLCATYTGSDTTMSPFIQAMETADRSAEYAKLRTLGYTDALLEKCRTSKGIYATLAHDAALHGMKALTSYEEELAKGKTVAELGSKIQYVRNFTSVGATGEIKLEQNGDRNVVDLIVYNSFAANTQKTIGFVKSSKFSFLPDSPNEAVPLVTLLGESKRSIPQVYFPPPPASLGGDGSNTGLIVGIVIPLIVVIAVGVAVVMKVTAPKTRNNSAAPKDPEKPFAVVFTDIQSSTALWAREPEVMSDAVEMHHLTIRDLIKKHGGYEVKTIGDSFMVAFVDCTAAVNFALDIQVAIFKQEWFEGAIDNTYKDLMEENGINIPPNYETVWNGIRVRVGVHYGRGSIQEDPVTLGFDYYGTVVNTAARVEGVGHGGQVLVTDEAMKEIKIPDIDVLDLGGQPLRGLDDPIHLFQLSRKNDAFGMRTFPPLRLDHEVQEMNSGEDSDYSKGSDKSMVSNASRMSTAGLLKVKAGKYAKSQGLQGSAALIAEEELLQQHVYTKTLFSTCKEEFRNKTIAHIANKWRVTGVTEKSLKSSSRDFDLGILDVVSRTLTAAKAKQGNADLGGSRRSHDTPGEGSIMMLGDSVHTNSMHHSRVSVIAGASHRSKSDVYAAGNSATSDPSTPVHELVLPGQAS